MGNSHLYELVRSLTQNEKRYFKLMAAQQSGNDPSQSVKLFDAIAKQSVYDEELLKKKFKRFAALKLYLYDFILKSLAQYNNQSFESIRIRKLLDDGEVLQRKGLYAQAIKRLEKAEKLSEGSGSSFVLHDILRLKLSCMSMIGTLPLNQFDMQQQLAQMDDAMLKMNQTNYIFVKSIALVHWCMHLKSKVGNTLRLEEIIDRDYIALEGKLLGRFNQHYYYRTLKMYYDENGNAELWKESAIKHIGVFEDDSNFLLKMPSNYFHALSSLLTLYARERNEKEAERMMLKAKAFLNNRNAAYSNKTNDVAHLGCVYFNMLLRNGDVSKIVIERSLLLQQYSEDQVGVNLYAQQWTKHLLSLSFMRDKQWKEALKWNNELINHTQFGQSNFLYFEGYVQNILLHYCLGNLEYVERLSKSVHKIIEREQVLSKEEKSLLQFFYKLSRNVIKDDDVQLVRRDCKKLTRSNHFIYDFMEGWLLGIGKLKHEKRTPAI